MSINKVILVGHVGKDPEVRYFDNNLAMARFSVATTERGYTTKTGQVIPDRTEWHSIVVWRRLAEVVEKYVKKGTQLYIEGKIRNRSYDDKDGVKRYTTEIQVDILQILGRRTDGESVPRQESGSTPQASYQPTMSAQVASSPSTYRNQMPPQTSPLANVPPPTPSDELIPPHSESFLAMDDLDDLPF